MFLFCWNTLNYLQLLLKKRISEENTVIRYARDHRWRSETMNAFELIEERCFCRPRLSYWQQEHSSSFCVWEEPCRILLSRLVECYHLYCTCPESSRLPITKVKPCSHKSGDEFQFTVFITTGSGEGDLATAKKCNVLVPKFDRIRNRRGTIGAIKIK